MTVACLTMIVGLSRRPHECMSIVGDAFSGLLGDLSLNLSFRFGLSFSWPSALPMSNLVQLAVSLAVIGAKYAFAIYAFVMKYVIGMDAGATWLNTNMITQIFQLVAFTVFALAKAIANPEGTLSNLVRGAAPTDQPRASDPKARGGAGAID